MIRTSVSCTWHWGSIARSEFFSLRNTSDSIVIACHRSSTLFFLFSNASCRLEHSIFFFFFFLRKKEAFVTGRRRSVTRFRSRRVKNYKRLLFPEDVIFLSFPRKICESSVFIEKRAKESLIRGTDNGSGRRSESSHVPILISFVINGWINRF